MEPGFQDSALSTITGTMPVVALDSGKRAAACDESQAEAFLRQTPTTALMDPEFLSLDAASSVRAAASLIQNAETACLIITEGSRPVGVVTQRDMVRILSELLTLGPADHFAIRDFMSAPPVCIDVSASLADALQLMRSRDLAQLPVTGGQRVLGLLTREALMLARLNAAEKERDAIEERVNNRSRELSRANRELKALALQDSLLRTGNRRAMEMDLSSVHDNALRYRQSYALGLIDVDYFKRYNDHYGHRAGDKALVQVARSIRQSLRRGDRVYRYGGEELLVLMPATSLNEAMEAMVRLVENLRALDIPHTQSPHRRLTISAGVSAFSAPDGSCRTSWETVLEEADTYLYQAKALGRNQAYGLVESRFSADYKRS